MGVDETVSVGLGPTFCRLKAPSPIDHRASRENSWDFEWFKPHPTDRSLGFCIEVKESCFSSIVQSTSWFLRVYAFPLKDWSWFAQLLFLESESQYQIVGRWEHLLYVFRGRSISPSCGINLCCKCWWGCFPSASMSLNLLFCFIH